MSAVSPDGSRIALLAPGDIWQMGPNGEHPARLLAAPPGESFWAINWSPDGRWLSYIRKIHATGVAVLEAFIPGEGGPRKVFQSADLQGASWLSSTRMVLNLWEAPDQPTSNLWELEIDPKLMRSVRQPRRLTNWAGAAIAGVRVSSDGRRVAVVRRADQSDISIGELAADGDKLLFHRRLALDERVDWPGGWSADAKTLFFQSDRTGRMSIFRQSLGSPHPESAVANQDDNRGPMLSPDGRWILYLASPPSTAQRKTARLLRAPVGGGPAELILETSSPNTFVTSGHVIVPTAAGHPAFRCPTRPGLPCILSEVVKGEVRFSTFDAAPSASKAEILRVEASNPNNVCWDLSPDGSRIAYSARRSSPSFIRVRDLRLGTTRDISLPDWPELLTLGWSADGRSLFATDFAPAGSSLLHVTLDGRVSVLYRGVKELESPRASPDGRYVAFGEVVSSSNVWLIEGDFQ